MNYSYKTLLAMDELKDIIDSAATDLTRVGACPDNYTECLTHEHAGISKVMCGLHTYFLK